MLNLIFFLYLIIAAITLLHLSISDWQHYSD